MSMELNFEHERRVEPAPEARPPLPSAAYAHRRVLLASASPRRRELLGMILPGFEIVSGRDVDETYPADLPAVDVPAYLSRLKAAAYADTLADNDILITADTVVILDGHILGKPTDASDACRMLAALAGRTHTVVTGVTITTRTSTDTFSESTRVSFAPLSDAEIAEYVARFRPLDKAGAYGIQEWIGAAAIERIDGCFYNVMGLPLHALYRHLLEK